MPLVLILPENWRPSPLGTRKLTSISTYPEADKVNTKTEMTDQQLYLAFGLPTFLYLLGSNTTILILVGQAKSAERTLHATIDGLQRELIAQFQATREMILRVEQVAGARIKWLEEHAK